MKEKYGYWTVNDKKFAKKFDALLYASDTKSRVYFYYHDSVWKNVDRSQLGKYSLKTLYKERAQQLRDNYNYLILYYSGGADSHNVLRTYIDNNIKLDEICIKWPKPLMDGKLYTPNCLDTSAKNYWSEWNYSIKPTLEWLSSTHPEIKITIKDYTESIDDLKIDDVFEQLNFVRGGGILLNSVVSDSERKLTNRGRTVGHIYGIDKPLLYTHDNRIYIFFTDVCLDQVGRSKLDEESSECFYWSPDYPILAMEQAYQLSLYYVANQSARNYLWTIKIPTSIERVAINQFQNDLARDLLYDNWDNRFQADKPSSDNRRDKFFWFYEHDEFSKIRNRYFDNLSQRVKLINESYLTNNLSSIPVYNVIISKYIWIADIK